MRSLLLHLLILALFSLMSTQAVAQDDVGKRAGILFKTLSYVRGLELDKGTSERIGVLYDPKSDQSQRDARAMKSALDKLGKDLTVDLVSIQSIGGNSNFSVLVVGGGMSDHFDSIKNISQKDSIFTISTDSACARENCCALAVSFEASVKVYLNENVLENTGFDVDSTFRYLAIRV